MQWSRRPRWIRSPHTVSLTMSGDVTAGMGGRGNSVQRTVGRSADHPVGSASWDRVPMGSRPSFYGQMNDFLRDLGMAELPSNALPSMGYAAIAADAVDVLMRAAQLAYSTQHGAIQSTEIDRGGVLLALERLDQIDGYSGLAKLHGAKDGHHALDRPVLLVAVGWDGNQIVVCRSGRSYAQQQQTAC